MSKTKLLIPFPPNFLLHPMSSPFQVLATLSFQELCSKSLSQSWLPSVSPIPHPIFQQILLVPPSKYTQDPTTLHCLHCHHSGPGHHVLLSVAPPSSVSLAFVHFILSQYSQNNHLKIELYSLKTLSLLRGKFKDFTMTYKALHNLALATSVPLSLCSLPPPTPAILVPLLLLWHQS